MMILPIKTRLLQSGDSLADEILKNATMQAGDILVVSSKAVARTEGRTMDLGSMKPTKEAERLAMKCKQDPRFTELVLQETKRMNGEVVGVSPFAILTSLRPSGMKHGRILCPNAGLDQSNVEQNSAIGWPLDPIESLHGLKEKIEQKIGSKIGIILSDSCCMPGRLGVIAFALACIGFDPFQSEIGSEDLFGKKMRVTNEAVADQLATAANTVMGNSDQSSPAAIIRDHGFALSDFSGWIDGIEPEEDLFSGFFDQKRN